MVHVEAMPKAAHQKDFSLSFASVKSRSTVVASDKMSRPVATYFSTV